MSLRATFGSAATPRRSGGSPARTPGRTTFGSRMTGVPPICTAETKSASWSACWPRRGAGGRATAHGRRRRQPPRPGDLPVRRPGGIPDPRGLDPSTLDRTRGGHAASRPECRTFRDPCPLVPRRHLGASSRSAARATSSSGLEAPVAREPGLTAWRSTSCREQLARHEVPELDAIIVAAGSGSTAAGLLAGIVRTGAARRIIAVQVAPNPALRALVLGQARVRALAA